METPETDDIHADHEPHHWKNCTDRRVRSLHESDRNTQVLRNREVEARRGERGRRGAGQVRMRFTLLIDLSIFKVVQLMKNNYRLFIAHYLNDCNSVGPYVTRALLGTKEKTLLTAASEEIAVRRTRVSISRRKVLTTRVSHTSGNVR